MLEAMQFQSVGMKGWVGHASTVWRAGLQSWSLRLAVGAAPGDS